VTPFDLLILALATWYLSHVITTPSISGPYKSLALLRERVSLGGLTHCKVCFAPWAAALLFVLGHTPLQPIVVVLALAGAALMLGSFSGANHS
jgi:hypothetical protein